MTLYQSEFAKFSYNEAEAIQHAKASLFGQRPAQEWDRHEDPVRSFEQYSI